jgi:acetoin utilization protein AcuB
MRLADLMETSVATVTPELPAEHAWQRMRQRRIHHLVVVDGSRVIGLLSDRDLGSVGGLGLRQNRAVGDLMTRHVVTARPTTTVREAANLMRGRSIGCLPVIQKDRLVGIVTVSDLLMLIGRGAERGIAPSRRWTLKSRGARGQGVVFHRGLPGR